MQKMNRKRKREYTEKLERIARAHEIFKSRWERLRPNQSANETYRLLQVEYENREKAVIALFASLEFLREPFLNGDAAAIDAVLDFLEVDTAAFRAGYAKEWYFRQLKRLHLSEEQKQRIRNLAIRMLSQPGYRRECLELSRLLITLADQQTVVNLCLLAQKTDNAFARKRVSRVLEKVLNHNQHLRQFAQPAHPADMI